jgi:hypothetical protein
MYVVRSTVLLPRGNGHLFGQFERAMPRAFPVLGVSDRGDCCEGGTGLTWDWPKHGSGGTGVRWAKREVRLIREGCRADEIDLST